MRLTNFSLLGQKRTSIAVRPFGGSRPDMGEISMTGRLPSSESAPSETDSLSNAKEKGRCSLLTM